MRSPAPTRPERDERIGVAEKSERMDQIEELTGSSAACKEEEKPCESLEELSLEANCIYAYVGFMSEELNEENKVNLHLQSEKSVDSVEENAIVDDKQVTGDLMTATQGPISPRAKLGTSIQLLPHEKRGWWSDNRYDKRMRLRTTIMGAVNDVRTAILMDTGANVSIISESFARKLGLKPTVSSGQGISIQGIGKERMAITKRVEVKITLGWQLSYAFMVWVGDHHGGANLILGTDFMMPAGVRLDLYQRRIKLPDEVAIPIAHRDSEHEEVSAERVAVAPTRCLMVDPSESVIFKIQRRSKNPDAVLWVRKVAGLLPTILSDRKGRAKFIRMTNPTDKIKWLSAHAKVGEWVNPSHLPWDDGFVRENSRRYKDWQIILTEHLQDEDLKKYEKDAYLKWLSSQPAATRPKPAWIGKLSLKDVVVKKGDQRADDQVASIQVTDVNEKVAEFEEKCMPTGVVEGPGATESSVITGDGDPESRAASEESEESGDLRRKLVECVQVDEMPLVGPQVDWFVSSAIEDVLAAASGVSRFEHEAADLYFEDFADELAMLPDFTELTAVPVDVDAADMCEPECTGEQKDFVKRILKASKSILIASGNALPPTARGVVCDIDVGDHRPIAQKSRRIPMKTMRKLFELLKGLLTSGLVKFSKSQWASPIVIVMKKNKIDIRLCIDYRLVNAITIAMEYPMPLVEDLLDNFEMAMWFCSLDAASGFWAIEMTQRASDISAFVCPLGHFQWLRMPFGLKNAPMIYQRMIDNALWGFVQPAEGWNPDVNHGELRALLREAEVKLAEEASELTGTKMAASEDEIARVAVTEGAPVNEGELQHELRQAGTPVQATTKPGSDLFDTGEPDESGYTPVLGRRSFVDDISFGHVSFWGCCILLIRLFARFQECRISISMTKSLFLKKKVGFLSHDVSASGVEAAPKNLPDLQALPFPKSKRQVQSFLGSVNYYHRFVQDFSVYGALLYELQDEDFDQAATRDLGQARAAFEHLRQRLTEAPILKHFQSERPVYVMLYANTWAVSATIMQEHDDVMHPVKFVGRVLKQSELNYQLAEKEILALLRVLKVCYTMLVGRKIHVLTRFSSIKWVFTSKSTYGRHHLFATLLSPWDLVINRVNPSDCGYAGLLTAGIVPPESIDEALGELEPERAKGKVPEMVVELVPRDYDGYLVSFDGSARTPPKGGQGACSFVLWKLPEWTVELAVSHYLEEATVNEAEYRGMLAGIQCAFDRGIKKLYVVGDSRIAVQQVQGRIQCKKDNLQVLLAQVQRLENKFEMLRVLHVPRAFNGSADSLANETLKSTSPVEINDRRIEMIVQLNKLPDVVHPVEEVPEGDRSPVPETKSEVTVGQIAMIEVARRKEKRGLIEFGKCMSARMIEAGRLKKQQELDDLMEAHTKRKYPRKRVKCGMTKGDLNHMHGLCNVAAAERIISAARVATSSGSVVKDGQWCDKWGVFTALGRGLPAKEFEPASFKDYSDLQAVQDERFRRIAQGQDEEKRWKELKDVINGNVDELTRDEVATYLKIADAYAVDQLGVLWHTSSKRKHARDTTARRLVVPTTLIPEVLYACHCSLEGGHQGVGRTFYKVSNSFYWPGMYRDVEKYVLSCIDCDSGKGVPRNRGRSPGNIIPTRPFQVVSLDFVIPLPASRRGNVALLLFQDMFSGYVLCKPMKETDALSVAKAFEEVVFQRFGAPEVIRHDRDPRFMSEVFQEFTKLIKSRSRATLSYRPQANGQQERSVMTVIQTVRMYVEDPDQGDWDTLAERLMFSINTSFDYVRKDTPFFIVHGWDPRSTLEAMIPTRERGGPHHVDAAAWRRQVIREHQRTLLKAKELQRWWKSARATRHNARVSADSSPGFEVGDAVWLYIAKVREGLKKKLAHLWHGPFRIIRKVSDSAYELELPQKEGYRFYPVVHVARLKLRREYPERPQVELTVEEEERFDFDEELLPDDSWEICEDQGEFEVIGIEDDRWLKPTRTGKRKHQYLVRWKGYDDPSWIDEDQLSCGALLQEYDDKKRRKNRLRAMHIADE